MLDGARGRAEFTDNNRVRINLWREWHDAKEAQLTVPYVCFIGMNPSAAAADLDDKTIRNEIELTRRLGLQRYCKVNLFGLCATDPVDLENPEYEKLVYGHIPNEVSLICNAMSAHWVVAAWGVLKGRQREYADEIARRILGGRFGMQMWCYGTTQDGSPRHTSRLGYDTELVEWKGYPVSG